MSDREMNDCQGKVPPGKKCSVLLADDDPIVREVVKARLSEIPGFQVIGEADDGKSAVEQVEELHPDVLLLDLLMPNLPGIEALQELASRHAKAKTIVFSASVGPQQIVQALQLGARGILSKKSLSQLELAIREVLNGNYWIEGREETIPGRLDLPPAVPVQLSPDDRVMRVEEGTPGTIVELRFALARCAQERVVFGRYSRRVFDAPRRAAGGGG